MFLHKPLDIFSPKGGCSEGLDAFRFFFKNTIRFSSNNIRYFMPRRSRRVLICITYDIIISMVLHCIVLDTTKFLGGC